VDDRDASKDDEGWSMVPVAIDEPPSIELYGFLTVDVNARLEPSAGIESAGSVRRLRYLRVIDVTWVIPVNCLPEPLPKPLPEPVPDLGS